MKKVIQLVDDITYVQGNCFQHQLLDGLRRACSLTTIGLREALQMGALPDADIIISCLKLRTLDKKLQDVSRLLMGQRTVIYDQDPWESFKIDGACNGAYSRIVDSLHVGFFATTTYAWEVRLQRLGFPARYVRMGMLSRYCCPSPPWEKRDIDVGFVGQVHPYRARLFDGLQRAGVNVQIVHGGDYSTYLSVLSRIKVFVHREAGEYDVNGEGVQYAEGLWAKDVEAITRGCISVRNWHPDAIHHMPDELIGNGLRMFSDDSIDEAVNIIKGALEEYQFDAHDVNRERQACARAIADDDAWFKAAKIIIDEH